MRNEAFDLIIDKLVKWYYDLPIDQRNNAEMHVLKNLSDLYSWEYEKPKFSHERQKIKATIEKISWAYASGYFGKKSRKKDPGA